MLRVLRELGTRLLYPPRCLACGGGQVTSDLCWSCQSELHRIHHCHKLGTLAVCSYSGIGRDFIRRLKYDADLSVVPFMANAMAKRIENHKVSIVCPVPAHWSRTVIRGIDHAALLARAIAHKLNLPCNRSLIRQKPTPPLHDLGAADRRSTLKRAFRSRSPWTLRGHDILLVDDVLTTGTTIENCTTELLASNARSVTGLVFARRLLR